MARLLTNRYRAIFCALLVGSCAWLLPFSVAGQDSQNSQNSQNPLGLAALQRFFGEISTFRASFAQWVLNENLEPLDHAEGVVQIMRPQRFRWDYAPPNPQQIVGDGATLWFYDLELAQITKRDQVAALGESPAILLAGEGELRDKYQLTELGRRGSIDWVRLSPKQVDDSGFSEVRIGFEAQQLRVLELLDGLGQRTRIRFSEVEENPELTTQLFTFTPPAGVDIIDSTH